MDIEVLIETVKRLGEELCELEEKLSEIAEGGMKKFPER